MGFLWPSRQSLRLWPRLFGAAALEIALAVYTVPRWDQVRDISDPIHNHNGLMWSYVVLLGPILVLVILSPVAFLGTFWQRWCAIILGLFPLYLAGAGWL